jgi:hypothetical protein
MSGHNMMTKGEKRTMDIAQSIFVRATAAGMLDEGVVHNAEWRRETAETALDCALAFMEMRAQYLDDTNDFDDFDDPAEPAEVKP